MKQAIRLAHATKGLYLRGSLLNRIIYTLQH